MHRIDRIRTEEIKRVGDRMAYEYRNRALPLLRIDQHVQAEPMPDQPRYSILVVGIRGNEVGLLVPQLRDIRNLEVELDGKTFKEPGVHGSFQLEGQTVRLVDIHSIVENAFPQWFEQVEVAGSSSMTPEQALAGDESQTPRILLAEDSEFFRNQLVELHPRGWVRRRRCARWRGSLAAAEYIRGG